MRGDLLLNDLSISGFRGIGHLHLPRLGRVTLIVGENGVGKTTLLEAVRVYAARGGEDVLRDVLRSRGEWISTLDGRGGRDESPNWAALFHGLDQRLTRQIEIGPSDNDRTLRIASVPLDMDEYARWEQRLPSPMEIPSLSQIEVTFDTSKFRIPWVFSHRVRYSQSLFVHRPRKRLLIRQETRDNESYGLNCVHLSPHARSDYTISTIWPQVALTEDEDRLVESLKTICGREVQKIAVVSDGNRNRIQTVLVKINGIPDPVPLESLGDGALRFFSVALALASSRNGILTIDEADNGVHYTRQRDYWRMVLETALRNNVQVFATTHGWDCVRGFAEALHLSQEALGTVARIESRGGHLGAVIFDAEDSLIAAVQDIEIR